MWKELVPASIGHGGALIVTTSVSSLLIVLVLRHLLANAILASRTIVCAAASLAALRLLPRHDDDDVDAVASSRRRRQCERCALWCSDVAVIMASLHLVSTTGAGGSPEPERDDEEEAPCGGCEAARAVEELMERKVAGEGELREAFYAFDRDEDGFVTAGELWNVLRRLGMEEGARYDDCARMIAACDADADGRVSFRDFRAMMENAV